MKIYQVFDLKTAISFLLNHQENVILTNPKGSTRYYGTLVIERMFEILAERFSHVKGSIINIPEDDIPAIATSIKLGREKIEDLDQAASCFPGFHWHKYTTYTKY